jgi:hypothetical protein
MHSIAVGLAGPNLRHMGMPDSIGPLV